MRRLHYILVLLFISASYLFSQNEGNELIRVDTVIIVDTVIVVKIDTVIIEEFVSDTTTVETLAGEQEKKVDVKKYDFYNDYLPYLKETGGDTIFTSGKYDADDTDDTLALKRGDKIAIVILEGGISFFGESNVGMGSIAMRIPISKYFHVLAKYSQSITPDTKYATCTVMIGYGFLKGRSIFDISVGIPLRAKGSRVFDFGGAENRGIISTKDISYYYRFSKNTMFSVTLGSVLIIPTSLTAGVAVSFK
jgi:hypothetical protein